MIKNKVVILDFGSQTTHLISRRLSEMGIKVKTLPAETAVTIIQKENPLALILSGGPASVYQKDGLLPDAKIFSLGIPILGICYGLQATSYLLGGEVQEGVKGEYGASFLKILQPSLLFKNIPKKFLVWMSHFDEVTKLPPGFSHIGKTNNIKYVAIENVQRKIYCVQFHPEVIHTEYGNKILENFLFDISQISISHKKIHLMNFVTEFTARKVNEIKQIIGSDKAICALSGGIDSSTATVLVHRAIGSNLTCVYVDTGLMRLKETEEVTKAFNKLNIPLRIVKAQHKFLKNLKGVVDPEEKRRIIGHTFIEVLQGEALQMLSEKPADEVKFLIQGTIYPDVIESKGTSHSRKIKTHHNVAGLPKNMKLLVVEPLRDLYKDQVRQLAIYLGLPKEIVWRQVFPGPGLAVRIIGKVTKEKLEILRQADKIVEEEIRKAGLYEKLWMSFAVLTGIKTTGVTGDQRSYGETVAVRAITSIDTMTADWARLPYEVLAKISTRITSEIKSVNRVVYDITTKPPATMEWE